MRLATGSAPLFAHLKKNTKIKCLFCRLQDHALCDHYWYDDCLYLKPESQLSVFNFLSSVFCACVCMEHSSYNGINNEAIFIV